MYKHLKDIVRYVNDVGAFTNILLAAKDDGEALLMGMSDDSTLSLRAVYKTPLPEIRNQKIGLARLDVLANFLKTPAFSVKEGAEPSIEIFKMKGKSDIPGGIDIKSVNGHQARFKFMSPMLAKSKLTITKTSAQISDDDITFTPSTQFYSDFKSFSSVLGRLNPKFSLEVVDGVLYMNLGQEDTAQIPVADVGDGVTVNPTYTWSVEHMLKVLKQAPSMDNVTIGLSNEFGMIEISIDDENIVSTYRMH